MAIESIEEAWVVRPSAAALRPVLNAPRLTSASHLALREITIRDERGEARQLKVPVERPLTIKLDGRELVTLMTLGGCPEFLVLGYLRNQRIVDDVTTIESISVEWGSGTADVRMRHRAPATTPPQPGPSGASGCGLGTVFGEFMRNGSTADALKSAPSVRISRATLFGLLDNARQYDAVHRAAGSVHSCAVFRGAEMLVSIEDVSRHNGLDTVTGWMAYHGVPGDDKILFTTGRLTAEIVMKGAHNGIPIMVSRNGVTAMGCDLAQKLGMTLFGRAANRRFFCYTRAERYDPESPTD